MLNPFFLQGSASEKNLMQDLINESIQIYGVEVHYLPRKYITEKTVLREVIESVFDNAYPEPPLVMVIMPTTPLPIVQVAAATAVVSSAGTITQIRIINAGLGYTQSPTITIGNPSLTSTGNFIFNEVVVGSASSTTARVKSWNSITNILEVSNVTGAFEVGENIVGAASSASHELRLINVYPPDNGYSSNEEIENEADQIIDFSERNPFGVP